MLHTLLLYITRSSSDLPLMSPAPNVTLPSRFRLGSSGKVRTVRSSSTGHPMTCPECHLYLHLMSPSPQFHLHNSAWGRVGDWELPGLPIPNAFKTKRQSKKEKKEKKNKTRSRKIWRKKKKAKFFVFLIFIIVNGEYFSSNYSLTTSSWILIGH